MKVYALLLFVVGCRSVQWKAINDFKETFKQYSKTAADTISSIENILDTSEKRSELFLNDTYSNNPVMERVASLRLSDDKCFENFVDEENFKVSFQIQLYQLKVPLHSRIVDIRERLNSINSSLDIYSGIAESKLQSCKSLNGSCMEETVLWLESAINSLSCEIYPNCSNHSVRKRSTCALGQFSCRSGGRCIPGNYFCDTSCDCNPCDDEPSGCIRYCFEFRCSETFRCISKSKKCDGVDDCGDGSDEYGCPPPPPTTPFYTNANCSIHGGDFLCGSNKCISLEQVCDGYNDCGDWSDEGDHCNSSPCSPECTNKGGVCFTGPKESECLYECPPGTYETSRGCSRNPEAPLPTLLQVLEDTPRLMARYSARLKYLKTKTVMALSKALREVVRCKREEFSLLSKIIDFSPILNEKKEENSLPPRAVDEAQVGSSTPKRPENTYDIVNTEPPTEETIADYD